MSTQRDSRQPTEHLSFRYVGRGTEQLSDAIGEVLVVGHDCDGTAPRAATSDGAAAVELVGEGLELRPLGIGQQPSLTRPGGGIVHGEA